MTWMRARRPPCGMRWCAKGVIEMGSDSAPREQRMRAHRWWYARKRPARRVSSGQLQCTRTCEVSSMAVALASSITLLRPKSVIFTSPWRSNKMLPGCGVDKTHSRASVAPCNFRTTESSTANISDSDMTMHYAQLGLCTKPCGPTSASADHTRRPAIASTAQEMHQSVQPEK
jgi:hypothetical protein